jgi:hypothetical protein
MLITPAASHPHSSHDICFSSISCPGLGSKPKAGPSNKPGRGLAARSAVRRAMLLTHRELVVKNFLSRFVKAAHRVFRLQDGPTGTGLLATLLPRPLARPGANES